MKEAPEDNGKKLKPKKIETLKEKIHRHLNDKNDVITEQDLREIVVGVDTVDLQEPDEPALLAEDITPPETITHWTFLDDKE
ncbi:MAG: hypothetical protein Q8941_07165 [Bacteroidota bacterium]|nr:hypothetical protein [Bacteroidota bacterium]